jgi:hypothetical protein
MFVKPTLLAQLKCSRCSNLQSEHTTQRRASGRSYSRTSITDAQGCLVVDYWLIDVAGHAWSGGSPAVLIPTSQDLTPQPR